MESKANLSKSELAAIDMMIAYMQENNQNKLGDSPGKAVSAITDSAITFANMCWAGTCGPNVAQAVANVTGNQATQANDTAVTQAHAIPNVTTDSLFGLIGTGSSVGGLQTQEVLRSLAGPLNNLNEQPTLQNLIDIRNQYEK